MGIMSWRYQAARLWNTIPNYLRNMDTYHSFKLGLKELDLVGLQCLISIFNLVFLSIEVTVLKFVLFMLYHFNYFYIVVNLYTLICNFMLPVIFLSMTNL